MNIGIISNKRKDADFACLNRVINRLDGKGCTVFTLSEYGDYLSDNLSKITLVNEEKLFSLIDILILIGGDGTFLRVADAASMGGIKVLGINLGTVGFMTELESDELHRLDCLITGDYIIENRMMVCASAERSGAIIRKFRALNDVVVTHGTVSRMISLSLKVGGREINGYRADGIILATPTGSTAYSLSAGGPIIDPKVDAIMVTPICSHSITSRPIIFDGSASLEVEVLPIDDGKVFLTVDGCDNFELEGGDKVTVTKSDTSLKLIRLKDDSFYNILHNKLK